MLSGKLDTVLANVEEQAVERYEVLIEQLSRREHVSEKLKEENQMEWVRRMRNLENRAAEIVMQAGNDVRGLEVAIKNIINASYSRDLSAKIAAADH